MSAIHRGGARTAYPPRAATRCPSAQHTPHQRRCRAPARQSVCGSGGRHPAANACHLHGQAAWSIPAHVQSVRQSSCAIVQQCMWSARHPAMSVKTEAHASTTHTSTAADARACVGGVGGTSGSILFSASALFTASASASPVKHSRLLISSPGVAPRRG